MKDLLLIACGAGLQDGLNPCIFMTGALFVAFGLWLKKRSFNLCLFGIIFTLFYALADSTFDFGPGQSYVLHKNFLLIARIIYFVLGVWSFAAGVLFFKHWIMLRRRTQVPEPSLNKIRFFSLIGMGVCLLTIAMAVVLSGLATFWPIDRYIIVLGNEALIKGQWREVTPMLISYTLISMWPIWIIWAFIVIKNIRPSLLKIVCASIFFTASSCMILLFK